MMSGAMFRIAALTLASWRWNSAEVVAPREVGKPPPAPSPFMKFSTLPIAMRNEPTEAGEFEARVGLDEDRGDGRFDNVEAELVVEDAGHVRGRAAGAQGLRRRSRACQERRGRRVGGAQPVIEHDLVELVRRLLGLGRGARRDHVGRRGQAAVGQEISPKWPRSKLSHTVSACGRVTSMPS